MSRILEHVAGWMLAIPETQADWWEKVEELASLHRGVGWQLARWVSWGMDEYNLSAEDLAIQLNRSEQTIRNYHSVMHNHAATIAANYGLFVSHAVEVLGLPPLEQEDWLLKCHEGRWSTNKLRAELRAARVGALASAGTQTPAAPGSVDFPLCYTCRQVGVTTPATRVADNGNLVCDHHYYEQRGFVGGLHGDDPGAQPTGADYNYTDFDDGDDGPAPFLVDDDLDAAADAWVDSLPYTVRNQAQVFVKQFITFYRGV